MADRYRDAVNRPLLRPLVRRLGLPQPPRLARGGGPLPALAQGVLLGGATGGLFAQALEAALGELALHWRTEPEDRVGAVLYDASGLAAAQDLADLYRFFAPTVRKLVPNGRVVLFCAAPERLEGGRARATQRAVQGFARALGKEVGRRGVTVTVLELALGGEESLHSTLSYLLSPRSAYFSGQVVRVGKGPPTPVGGAQPLQGKRAVVTGAARGIGAAIAAVLAREGADVIGVDLPAALDQTKETVEPLGGSALPLDVTAPDAAGRLQEAAGGTVELLIHNAGITRDRTLGRMTEKEFLDVVGLNCAAVERINYGLLAAGGFAPGCRVICLSSIAGIAGNAGQTNYAASKAYLIGHVAALGAELAPQGGTANALAPGFIETKMTAAMPFGVREVGRRLNSLLQGGLPEDVAEAAAWLVHPGSGGINGSVVRICGQSLLGA